MQRQERYPGSAFRQGNSRSSRNPSGTVVEVKELSNVNQVGAEFVTAIWGDLATKRVSYRAGIEVMVPLAHNLSHQRSGFSAAQHHDVHREPF